MARAGLKLRHYNDSFGWTIESDERGATNGLNVLRHFDDDAGTSAMFIAQFSGNVGIGTTAPGAKLDVAGTVKAHVVTITGGSDVAEPFNVNSAGTEAAGAGMVVSIDPTRVGQMRLSDQAYDRTVAGIISGAGGVRPGMLLTQEGTVADGEHPVAMTGRVWCWCDAGANGAIQAGDLLTTAPTPGHAMKVTDHTRAPGATIGKAMSPLETGKGLVLVLVNLQ